MTTETERLAPAFPYSLQVEITSHCNLSCVMCPLTIEQTASGITKGHVGDLVWSEVKALARHAERVIIAGFGEPLVNKRALALMRELDDMHVHFSLTTNAHALTAEVARQMVAMSCLVHINISIDSPDPEVYQHVRGGPLDRALRGVRNLMAARPNPDHVTISSVLMEENLASLVQFPPLLAELGVKNYIIQGLANYNDDDPTKSLVSQGLLAEYIPQIEAACRAYGIRFLPQQSDRLDLEARDPQAALAAFYTPSDSVDSARLCMLPWEQPYIDKDGLVYPCCFAASKNQAVLGDLREAGLQAIWLGQRYDTFREAMLDGATTPGICRECLFTPMGRHPLRDYNARLVPELSQLSGTGLVRAVFENIGETSWTAADGVYVATSRMRNRPSRYFMPSWFSALRPCSFREAEVPPGGHATFEFEIAPDRLVGNEWFQVVVDGQLWIPQTEFEVSYLPASLIGRTIKQAAIPMIIGSSAWRPTPQYDNGVVVDRLVPPEGASLLVRPPMLCIDTPNGRYNIGDSVPAGLPCTIWFDRSITA